MRMWLCTWRIAHTFNLVHRNIMFGVDLGAPFFPGGHELWHHPLAYSAAAAAELPSAALQHATLVHPALHPQVPVRSYLWLNPEKINDQHQVSTITFVSFSFNFFYKKNSHFGLLRHFIFIDLESINYNFRATKCENCKQVLASKKITTNYQR